VLYLTKTKHLKFTIIKKLFTEGEWVLYCSCIYTNADIKGNIICEAPWQYEESNENWKKNATLICAAPKLFDALSRMNDYFIHGKEIGT